MDLQTIKSLIAAMAESDLAEMAFSENGWALTLRRGRATDAAAPGGAPRTLQAHHGGSAGAERETTSDRSDHHAPLAGILHLQPAPGADPFVQVGQKVRAGDTICIIEAMKVFNAVRAERDGVVAAILAATGAEVEAGQPLMRIE